MKVKEFRQYVGGGNFIYFSLGDPIPYDSSNPVAQFTGLTDINGVDIYEGDIVSCLHFTSYNGERLYHEHIVQWSDKFSGWFALNKGSMNEDDGSVQLWVYMKSNQHTAKVIGNIHQNPELLK